MSGNTDDVDDEITRYKKDKKANSVEEKNINYNLDEIASARQQSNQNIWQKFLVSSYPLVPPKQVIFSLLPGRTTSKHPPCRHISKSLRAYLFLILNQSWANQINQNNTGTELQIKRAFKSFFCHKKTIQN